MAICVVYIGEAFNPYGDKRCCFFQNEILLIQFAIRIQPDISCTKKKKKYMNIEHVKNLVKGVSAVDFAHLFSFSIFASQTFYLVLLKIKSHTLPCVLSRRKKRN